MDRRLFTACLGTETNSFSPIPTGMGLFERSMIARKGKHHEPRSLFGLPLAVWRDRGHERGWTVTEGLAAFATPAGDTTRETYEALRDEILADLERALPVDAVLLNLHGAMIADGYPDAEGDLLAHVRARVGDQVPILAELDLHGHLTQTKVDAADVIVFYKEYPHVDSVERAHELFDIAERMLEHGLKPAMAMHDCRMLGIYPTTREPLRSFVARMKQLEAAPGIVSVSLAHGFPWGDTPEVGMRVLVVTDNDPNLAAATASELGVWLWEQRREIVAPFVPIDAAIDRVIEAASDPTGRPFVLADMADNAGIGAGSDSTFMLARLIERKVGGFAISPLWDPVAVQLAFDAGVGARLRIRIGGKLGPASGDPIDAEVIVMGLAESATQPFGGSTAHLGDMAWLRIDARGARSALSGGDAEGATVDVTGADRTNGAIDDADAIDLIVNTVRMQAFDPVCYSAAGLEPSRPRALVVKSTQHFHAGFAPIAREVVYVATPGTGSMDFAGLAHRRVTARLWPRDANPHSD